MGREINAKVITDSINANGDRLTTLELEYPRFILPQMLTHRAFSRNTASSRAIPSRKLIEQVRTDPAMPVKWGRNCAGMQSWEEHEDAEACEFAWRDAAAAAADAAQDLLDSGLHKQIVNRVLEPFLWVKQIVSATEWRNFFDLRLDDQAQPEIWDLANCMSDAINDSMPIVLDAGDWHTPYVGGGLQMGGGDDELVNTLKISVARCARVSYLNHDGEIDVNKDLELYEKLRSSGHWSPFEHVAMPCLSYENGANYVGWQQLRHLKAYQ